MQKHWEKKQNRREIGIGRWRWIGSSGKMVGRKIMLGE